ncbi:MAG TPA: mannosyltransferase family protein [Solirubrobacteraceae bacterium]|nr:mannosyltransferase family protein [Solirubrobacteraceae bacterium]
MRTPLAALAASRALVWAVGVTAFAIYGTRDPRVPRLAEVWNHLAAPISRWDSVHFQAIAANGYTREDQLAFFPLYPLAARAAGWATGSLLLGGFLVSIVSFLIGLWVVGKLAELELGPDAGRRTVWLLALFPTSLFLSAFYTEGLFLALTAGAFYLARTGRFGWACAVGAAASATRNTGVLLVVPLVLLYFHGRERPVRADLAWLALVPLGLVAYSVYQAVEWDDALATWHVQTYWSRGFHGPFSAVAYAIPETVEAVGELFTGSNDAFESPAAKLALFGALCLAAAGVVGVFRRLPAAYGAYLFVALIPPLSSPWPEHPLMSFPRFLAVLFPLHMWLAIHTADRRRFAAVLVAFAAMLGFLTAKFATWGWAG